MDQHTGLNKIKAIVSDFDGTLVDLPTNYKRMRSRLKKLFTSFGIHSSFQPLIGSIEESLQEIEDRGVEVSLVSNLRKKAYDIIDDEELKAVDHACVQEGVGEILQALKDRGIKIAVVTRNGRKCVEETFNKFNILRPDLIVSRDDVKKIKPDKEQINVVLSYFNLKASDCIIVGDSNHDVELGENMGIPVFLLGGKYNSHKSNKIHPMKSIKELKHILS